ncbi:hypothetical protein ACOME3_009244 [Neoechinorhynchus agilis]
MNQTKNQCYNESQENIERVVSSHLVSNEDELFAHELKDRVDYALGQLLQLNDLIKSKQLLLASRLCSSLVQVVNLNIDLRIKLAFLNVQLDRYMHAIQELKFAHQIDPNNLEVVKNMTAHFVTMGEVDQSALWIRQCLKIDPDNNELLKEFKRLKPLGTAFANIKTMVKEERYKECGDELASIGRAAASDGNVRRMSRTD